MLLLLKKQKKQKKKTKKKLTLLSNIGNLDYVSGYSIIISLDRIFYP